MATTWIVIAAADLNDYAVGAKLNAARTAALAAGQADTFAAVMADVAGSSRQKFRSGGYKVSATANSIPPELKGQICWLVIEKLVVRLGRGLALSEDEKTLVKDAKDDINKVADGKLDISAPADPEATPSIQDGGRLPSVGTRTRSHTREDQDGM